MWIYNFGLVLVFVLVPLTFPDGQLPSRRWRPLAWLAVTLLVAVPLSGTFVRPGMLSEQGWIPNPYAIQFPADWPGLGGLTDLLELATLVASVSAFVSLIVRWRSAGGHVHQQILLVVVALGVVTLSFVVDAVAAHLLPAVYPMVKPLLQLIPIVLPVAIAVAVLRRRLFGIEVVVSRAAVYGLLALVLGLAYAAIVVVVGLALSTDASVGQWLGVAVVALAFAPAREVLQRWVGRRLLGDRREPYAALARLSVVAGSGRSTDNVLTRLVESVGESLKAPYVALSLRSDSGIEAPIERGTAPSDDQQLDAIELIHAGLPVGRLVVARRPWEALNTADRRLLDLLSLPLAATLHTLLLHRAVRQSHEELVRRVEEERRRLARDIHDGLGPRLAAIAMQVEAAIDTMPSDPDRAAQLLANVLCQTDHALRDARGIAHAHRPPTLASLGLVPALEAHLGHFDRARLEVPAALPALPAAVETAAYLIITEAVHNVVQHAGAGWWVVRLTSEGDRLVAEVEDNGSGLVMGTARGDAPRPLEERLVGGGVAGIGLHSMRERAEELGGSLTISEGQGGVGTFVRAVLPYAGPVLVTDPIASGSMA